MTTNSFNSVSNIDISHNEDYINMDNADELYSEQADQQTASSDESVRPASTFLASSSPSPSPSPSLSVAVDAAAAATSDDYSNDGTGVGDRLTDIDIDDSAERHEVLDTPSSDKLSMLKSSETGLFDDDYADEDAERYHRGHRQRSGHHGSGFGSDTNANNNDDIDMDDDDRDDDLPATNRRKYSLGHHRGATHKASRVRDEAYRESDSFKKVANKYANSDSIKVISTPHGKVSIVYQSASPANATKSDVSRKQLPPFVESTNRQPEQQQPQQKITPVLTPDGKVALLYRGASDLITNHKYEPIINVPSAKAVDADNPTNATNGVGDIKTIVSQTAFNSSDSIVVTTLKPIFLDTTATEAASYSNSLPPDDEPPRRTSNEEENVILPNINRPPSEVLGIKKNQFIQFRITDGVVTATPPISGGNAGIAVAAEPQTESLPPPPPDRVIIQPDQIVPNLEYDYESNGYNRENDPMPKNDIAASHNRPIDRGTSKISDIFAKTEVVNLAIIPSFDNHMKTNRINQNKADDSHNRQMNNNDPIDKNDEENEIVFDIGSHQIQNGKTSVDNNNNVNMLNDNHRLHHHRHPHLDERDLTAIHCAMQAMVAIAAISTIIGMLGAYIKQRVFDQITSMH